MAFPKVVGSETEFGLTVQNDRDFDSIATSLLLVNSYNADQSLRLLWDYDQEEPLVDARGFEHDETCEVPDQQDNMALNKILNNGARFYVDHAHPEYSTPECSNVLDLLRYEKAGERILNRSCAGANQLLPNGHAIIIYKNNSDRKGSSYGYHENYLLDRRTPFQLLAEHLMPFLVTRQIYSGAGKVGSENGAEPVPYQISQRADFFETEMGLDTMVKRPIINTRDEPHANRDRYRRLHVIIGDANMSEYTTYLKVGTMLLVLEMIEEGFLPAPLALRNPVRSLRDVSHDLTCKLSLPMRNGTKMTAIDIQRCFWESAQRYVETHADCHPYLPRRGARVGAGARPLGGRPDGPAPRNRLGDEDAPAAQLHRTPRQRLGRPAHRHDGPAVPRYSPGEEPLRHPGAQRRRPPHAQRGGDRAGRGRAAGGHPGVLPRPVSEKVQAPDFRRQLGLHLV